MKVSDSLTWLAEAVLKHALDIAWRDLTARHGVPEYVAMTVQPLPGRLRRSLPTASSAVSRCLTVPISISSSCTTRAANPEYRRAEATRQLDVLSRGSSPTVTFPDRADGVGHAVRGRYALRPDGQSGVMVSSIEAFERYQEAERLDLGTPGIAARRGRWRAATESARRSSEFVHETLAARVRREQSARRRHSHARAHARQPGQEYDARCSISSRARAG